MDRRRRIVPDNSVMVPAFFRETLVYHGNPFDLSARARPLAEAVRLGRATAFSPDAPVHEFMEVAYRKAQPRAGAPLIGPDDSERQFIAFAALPIRRVPAAELAMIAFDLVRNAAISPADSWYVACAILTDAELWISHDHGDGLVARARAVHRSVHTLTTERFDR